MDSDDYRPPTLSIADTTPSQRIGRNQPLSKHAKNRVMKADPNHGRCLVTNCAPDLAVEFAHCVPRSLAANIDLVCAYIKLCPASIITHYLQMEKLEWCWNLQLGTLNLDTRFNIFPRKFFLLCCWPDIPDLPRQL